MANNATPYVVAGVVGVAAVAGWWLWRRNRAQAGAEPPTLEILAPLPGTTVPSGTRVDFSARALVGSRDISSLIRWRIIEPDLLAGEWSVGATTFIIPNFLITRVLTMEAYVSDPLTGLSASARRSVTVTVTASLATADPRPLRDGREPTVLSVVNSFRRSDTGWRVRGREQGVLEEPWVYSRTRR
jgi:hypothetical protein